MAIGTIVCLSCGRPELVRRAVTSCLSATEVSKRSDLRLMIFDDTRDDATRAEIHGLGRDASRAFHRQVTVIDRPLREAWVRMLASETRPESVLRFALLGPDTPLTTFGASRNAVLVSAPSPLVLSLDDDMVWQFVRSRRERRSPSCTCAGDGTIENVWVSADRRTLLDSEPFVACEVLAEHERVLGCALGGTRRAIVSVMGYIGDCGWGTASGYLFLGDEAIRRLHAGRGYAAAVRSREMLRVADATVASTGDSRPLLGCAGFDVRAALPPFLPVGRGQDAVFGMLCAALQPDACFVHLPWAVRHDPGPRRAFASGEVLSAATAIDLSSLMILCVRWAWRRAGEAVTLETVGQSLIELGHLTPDQFRHALLPLLGEEIGRLTARLTETATRLDGHEATGWRRDAALFIDLLGRLPARPDVVVPMDVAVGVGYSHAMPFTLEVVRHYGALLTCWGDITRQGADLPIRTTDG